MEKRKFPNLPKWLTTKHIVKAAIILPLTAILAKFPVKDGHNVFGNEALWELIFFGVLINAWRQIANKTPGGWIWLGYFLYGNAWGQNGLAAWFYLALAGWCLWTFHKWKGVDTHAVG